MGDKNYKNILWGGIAFLLVFAPIARGAVRPWSVAPILLVSYLFVFLWAWRLNNGGACAVVRKTSLDKFIFLFFALAVVSSIFSVNKFESLNAFLRLLAYVGLYYVVLNDFDPLMRRRLLVWVVATGSAISAYGLLQYFGRFPHSWWFPPEFLSATYVNHNHFAGYLELVIPVAVGFLASCPAQRSFRALGLGILVVLFLIAFALTQSRAGWLSLGISLSVMAGIIFKRSGLVKKNLLVFVLICAALFVFSYSAKDVLSRRVKDTKAVFQGEREPSFENRRDIWKATLQMTGANPWAGVGLGAFDTAFYRYRPQEVDTRAVYAHNDYLHMAAEMGILAPFLMLGFLFVVLRAGFRRAADFSILGCAIGILSLSLHGLADFNFHIPANMLLLTVYAAFVMRASLDQKDKLC
jgi:O-antigen ligase